MSVTTELPAQLKRLIRKHQVPGASIGILRNGRIIATAAAGVTNIDTGVKTTVDTVFQIGSITKAFTASLIMQLVDEGLLDLDDTVVKHLPTFRVADLEVSRTVTIRDLLCHRSGIDGDFFLDAGRGDDSSARLLEMATMVPNLFPIGERVSYCNLGFVILGRIIEVTTGLAWDDAMQQNLFEPLGMTHAMTRPEDALRYRCAIGHVPSQRRKNTWYASKIPYLSLGQKAAGATPGMAVTDLLKFAGMHLASGRNQDGQLVLSPASVRAMQKRQIAVPRHTRGGITHWGLGWFLMNHDGQRLYGHDGATIGQYAFLRIHPGKKLAVALLTNGGDASGLATELLNDVLGRLAKATEPAMPDPERPVKVNLTEYLGEYANMNSTLSVTRSRGRLKLTAHPNGGEPGTGPDNGFLTPVAKDTFRLETNNPLLARNHYLFSRDDDGVVSFVAAGLRQMRRL